MQPVKSRNSPPGNNRMWAGGSMPPAHEILGVDVKEWKHYGHACHLIVGHKCRFHLSTVVVHDGKELLISTVGDYYPFENGERETLGADKDSFFETMVFEVDGYRECGCPRHSGEDLKCKRYSNAKEATKGHFHMCCIYSN